MKAAREVWRRGARSSDGAGGGRVAQGFDAVRQRLKIAPQIAAALDYAHQKSVVYRDLKPANVKVTPDGVIKLLDFGLAKAFTGQISPANPRNAPTLTLGATQGGVILATAAHHGDGARVIYLEAPKQGSIPKRAVDWDCDRNLRDVGYKRGCTGAASCSMT